MLKHKDWKSLITIRVRSGKLYKLKMDTLKALINNNSMRDQGKLWHGRMSHIDHGELRLLHESVTGVLEVSMKHDDVYRG